MKLAAIAVVCGLFSADAAWADSCPQLMDEFGDLLVKATVDDSVPVDDRALALALHDEGEALYDSGDDDQCVEKLEEALKILGGS
jgi:glyoxylase-like metal-dependent hydrolase (beta-lactamase superfamily II)